MAERMVEATPDGMVELVAHHGDGSLALRRWQDVTPALEANKRLACAGDGYSPSRDLRRIASIPTIVQLAWIDRYGVDPLAKGNEGLLRRLLNDPEWRHLRTSPGRV